MSREPLAYPNEIEFIVRVQDIAEELQLTQHELVAAYAYLQHFVLRRHFDQQAARREEDGDG